MNRRHVGVQNLSARSTIWLGVAACLVARAAAADDAAAPAAGLAAQERAQAAAVELVRGVIDGQLRQLEENGLGDRPIHADIRALRGAIESLIRKEMQEVIDLLGRAEAATDADRAAVVDSARTRARAIVTRLAAERQQVVRRLKEATLAAEIRAVLARQSRLLATTESLPTLADGRREQAILAAIDEERNVKTLLATLQASLADVSTWGGETGSMAMAGLRLLEKENVAAAVLAAENSLSAADPAGAAAEQRRAIAGLESVLAVVEGNQSGQRVDPAATGKDAAALAGRAAAMRIEMAKVPLTDETVERLLAEQSALQESLAKLVGQARGEPAVSGFVARAKEAALQAAASLLEGDQQRALASQDVVIESLERLATRQEAGRPAVASAEDFTRQAAELMNVLERVQDFSMQQAEIGRAAAARPQAAVEAERQLAARMAKLLAEQQGSATPDPGNPDGTRAGRGLPAAVEQRLQITAEAAAQAAQAKTPQEAQSAIQVATEAMQTAAREIANALADARRKSLAAKAGELSRAAEVAERVATAEQNIAAAARQAAEQRPATQESVAAGRSAADLAARQAEVAAVTDTMKDAVDGLSPEAAKLIEAARAAMEAAKKELASQAAGEQAAATAEEQAPDETTSAGKTPVAENVAASSAPADKAPEQAAAEAAARASQSLAKAAATMRDKANKTEVLAKAAAAPGGNEKTAAELAANAKELAQAAQMTERAAAAERGIAEATKQAADKAEQLIAAEAKPPAPAALEALEATKGDLARKQAEVAEAAEAIEEVAAALAPEAAKMIEAARADIKAAEELLASRADGDDKKAGTNNGEKASAEQTAANQAKQPGEQGPKQPGEQVAKQPGPQAAAQAAASAAKAAEQANESLAKAAAAMRKDAQQAAEELARTAAEQTAAASQARQAAEQAAAAQSPTSPPPGQQAGPTRPQQPAGQPQPGTNSPRKQAESLAARETALAREELLAHEIAAAIAEQSSAREAVAATARQLEQMPADAAAQQPTANDREQMASALAAAKERFANAQRAAGERVAAVLDQTEVGNQPLRQSLAEASQQDDLGTGFVPKSPEATADMIAGEQVNAPANQAPAANPNSQQASTQQASTQQASTQQASTQQASTQQASTQQASAQQDGSSGGRIGEARDNGPLSEIDGVDRKRDPGSRAGDTDLVDKSFERDAWFAKLPPEVRKAIRAGSQRRAPRGYEEKMDRYFKNLE